MSLPLVALPDGLELPDDLLRALVARFYGRVRQDPDLGPVFDAALAGRWEQHLDTMVAFWSSVVLRTGRYHGKPHLAHARLPLSEVHFARWLQLFERTAEEICPPPLAALLMDRAQRIAESLQMGRDIGAKALRPPVRSLGEPS